MTRCEFRFENLLLIGAGDYLDAVTAWLDELFQAQWVLDDAIRSPERDGWWCLCLYRMRA